MDDEFSVLGQRLVLTTELKEFQIFQVFLFVFRYKSKHSSGSSSIGVLRTDSECMLDGILFDGESRGSSISLNSTCSSKSQHDTNPVHVFSTEECTNG